MRSRKPTVAFVAVTYRHGGSEQVLAAQAHRFLEQGFPVVVVVPRDEELDGFASELAGAGADVRRVAKLFDAGRNKRESLAELYRLFRGSSAEMVHFHIPWAQAGGEAILAAHLARVPRRLRTEHNPIMKPLRFAQRLKMLALDRLVHKIVFVSRGNRQRHIDNGRSIAGKSLVIPNGIDVGRIVPVDDQARSETRRALGLPPDALVAVAVAALEPRKGTLDFIRAAAQSKAKNPSLHYAVIGDGPIRGEAEALVEELGLRGVFHFLGFRSDVPRLLCAFDIFVQPSHYEGLALTMLEALAAGLPMVTTRVDGVEDVLTARRGALVVEPHDVSSLAAAMLELADDPALRKQLVLDVRDRVRSDFSTKKMIDRYFELYRDMGLPVRV